MLKGSKKAVATGTIVKVALAAAVIVVGLIFLYKVKTAGSSAMTDSLKNCDTGLQKCACFFENSRCPEGTKPQPVWESCPLDKETCISSSVNAEKANYVVLLEQTQAKAKEAKAKTAAEKKQYFGTCCVGDFSENSDVSKSLYNGYGE